MVVAAKCITEWSQLPTERRDYLFLVVTAFDRCYIPAQSINAGRFFVNVITQLQAFSNVSMTAEA